MNEKGSSYVMTTEESQISSYKKEFDDNDLQSNNHLTHLIKFVFSDRRLCALFGKYSQRDYRGMHDMELIYPLVEFGTTIVLGISNVLFIYLPKFLDKKQCQELIQLLSEQNTAEIRIGFSRLCDTDEFIHLESELTVEESIDYVKRLSSVDDNLKKHILK